MPPRAGAALPWTRHDSPNRHARQRGRPRPHPVRNCGRGALCCESAPIRSIGQMPAEAGRPRWNGSSFPARYSPAEPDFPRALAIARGCARSRLPRWMPGPGPSWPRRPARERRGSSRRAARRTTPPRRLPATCQAGSGQRPVPRASARCPAGAAPPCENIPRPAREPAPGAARRPSRRGRLDPSCDRGGLTAQLPSLTPSARLDQASQEVLVC